VAVGCRIEAAAQQDHQFRSAPGTVLQRGAGDVGNGLQVFVASLGLAGIAWLCAAARRLLTLAAPRRAAAFVDRERQGS
jgi:hypothetical protein